jgi:hypothetical protein
MRPKSSSTYGDALLVCDRPWRRRIVLAVGLGGLALSHPVLILGLDCRRIVLDWPHDLAVDPAQEDQEGSSATLPPERRKDRPVPRQDHQQKPGGGKASRGKMCRGGIEIRQ